jgi:peptide subunit release factor 1 (eRF1)
VASIRIELSKGISASQTGAVLLWGESCRRLIMPPFPQREKYVTSGYDVAPLRLLLTRDFRIGIVLVRLGSFSIGVCEGDRLIEHKAGTGLVHGRQRQGGSSAARFQRRRGEQAHQFLLRVAGHAEEKLTSYAKILDFLVYGGARTAIRELLKMSRFLAQFDDRLLPPLLSIPDPRYEVLEEAVTDIWSSHVTEWLEDPAD